MTALSTTQTCKMQLYYLKNCYIYTMVGDLGKSSLCKTAVTQGRRVFSFVLFWVFFLFFFGGGGFSGGQNMWTLSPFSMLPLGGTVL